MRRYTTHAHFDKMFIKLSSKLQLKFLERSQLFLAHPTRPLLYDHSLRGRWADHRSINVSGDYRAIYRSLGAEQYLFVAIGTHHELFGT